MKLDSKHGSRGVLKLFIDHTMKYCGNALKEKNQIEILQPKKKDIYGSK